MRTPNSNLLLGLGCLAFALFLALVWIPLDVETGLVEKVRRRHVIGDALAPTLAAVFIALAGLGLLLFERRAQAQPVIPAASLRFLAAVILLTVIGFAIMRYAGPLAVELAQPFAGADLEYRLLRDTAPWKYIGFLLGGTFLVASLVTLVETRLSWRAVLIGVLACLAIIATFDLPFDDLLLPPNGDV